VHLFPTTTGHGWWWWWWWWWWWKAKRSRRGGRGVCQRALASALDPLGTGKRQWETHLRSLISLKNCKWRGGRNSPTLRYARTTVKYWHMRAYLYVSATSLLGLPVTQGRLAEIHTPYFSLSGNLSSERTSSFRRGGRPTVLAEYPPDALDIRQRRYSVPFA